MSFREAFARQLAYQLWRQVIGYAVGAALCDVLARLLERADRLETERVFRRYADARAEARTARGGG